MCLQLLLRADLVALVAQTVQEGVVPGVVDDDCRDMVYSQTGEGQHSALAGVEVPFALFAGHEDRVLETIVLDAALQLLDVCHDSGVNLAVIHLYWHVEIRAGHQREARIEPTCPSGLIIFIINISLRSPWWYAQRICIMFNN
jgi:hypothetical protein